MHTPNILKLPQSTPLSCLALLIASHTGYAMDYGIFDARGLAMGGTVMAVGDTAQSQYYNPALLAFHIGDEDKTRDGRTYFPTLVVQASNTLDSVANAVNDKLDTKVSSAVNAYNSAQNAANAGAIASSASDLRKVLNKIANKDINLDSFVGLSVSEPSDHEGGAFYVGVRIIGAGTSTITPADLTLLNDYIAATTQIANGAVPATVAAQYPNLINANGALKDPTKSLTSSADVGALAIGEWGLALAKEFTFWDQAVSLGITPKLMRVDAYRDDANFNNTSLTNVNDSINQFSDTKSTHITFNADLGAAAIIANNYRVGIAVKDAFAKNFTTQQDPDPITGLARPDLIVKLHPRSRMGFGYVNDDFSVGLDYDLKKSTPIANEAPSQNLSLGGEYRLFDGLALRLGYHQDRTGLRANATSAGIGYHWHRFVADLGYSSSSDTKGGGLQLGWAF